MAGRADFVHWAMQVAGASKRPEAISSNILEQTSRKICQLDVQVTVGYGALCRFPTGSFAFGKETARPHSIDDLV
jgi:hypothetical protein